MVSIVDEYRLHQDDFLLKTILHCDFYCSFSIPYTVAKVRSGELSKHVDEVDTKYHRLSPGDQRRIHSLIVATEKASLPYMHLSTSRFIAFLLTHAVLQGDESST